MTYHKEEYTLHNGQKIYVQYNEYNICQVTKECIEMLLDLYQQGRADAIDDYYRTLNEKINTDTNLKDTIKDIHDNVAREMYCKGVDDFVNKINESNQGHWRPTRYEHGEVVSETMSYDIGTIRLIAKELKAGVNNE